MPSKKQQESEQEIQGTVRLGGRTFVAGQEQELEAMAEEMGVEVTRAYGVSSTEAKPGKINAGPRGRARALAKQEEMKAAGNPGQKNAKGLKAKVAGEQAGGEGSEGGATGDVQPPETEQ